MVVGLVTHIMQAIDGAAMAMAMAAAVFRDVRMSIMTSIMRQIERCSAPPILSKRMGPIDFSLGRSIGQFTTRLVLIARTGKAQSNPLSKSQRRQFLSVRGRYEYHHNKYGGRDAIVEQAEQDR